MEEEVGIKVTRLRRRLSVEADDVKSPSTQSTPTKKRGGRLAAKPQLELIDENSIDGEKPKRTRKSTIKDAEPEEKVITPARRSTRIRSNTSIVSETPLEAEDKGTPSRRSTRIKSNTSIVAETVQFSDSPRAKRAARRTSQVGSDNEAPITPARQTRRTRKDSTSSVDKQVEAAGKLATQVKEVIVEETENNVQENKSKSSPAQDKNESPRKSPRQKTGRRNSSLDNNNKENEPASVQKLIVDEKPDTVDSVINIPSTKTDQNNEIVPENNLSVSSSNLINELESQPKKGKSVLNRTTSETEQPQEKGKRHRTKSWTTISTKSSNDKDFLSDTEAVRKKNSSFNAAVMSGSGDGILNKTNRSADERQNKEDIKEVLFNHSMSSGKKKKKSLDKSSAIDTPSKQPSNINTSTVLDNNTTEIKDSSLSISKQDFDLAEKYDPNYTEKFFGAAPSGTIQSLVYIEDSDSNTESVDKANVNKEFDTEEQCVPVVQHQLEDDNTKETKSNLSYEPMDIDETMPENISISVFTDQTSAQQEVKETGLEFQKSNVNIDNSVNKSLSKSTILDSETNNEITANSKRNSMTNIANNDDVANKSMSKSQRKSIIANTGDDNMDENEQSNKSIVNDLNKSLNKSKRNNSISNSMDINLSDMDNNDSINKSPNKSKRKSSATTDEGIDIGDKSGRDSFIAQTNADNNTTNKSKRKSSISNLDLDKDSSIGGFVNEVVMNTTTGSKRKSSNSSINVDDKAENKSINTEVDNDTTINKNSSKSKRKSSIAKTHTNDSTMKEAEKPNNKSLVFNTIDNDEVDGSFKRKSSIENIAADVINNSSNKSNRKSSISNSLGDNDMDKKSVKSQRESTIADDDSDKSMHKSNNSKRKSSLTHTVSQILDKSSNENKSTLVLSQLKDTSDTNIPKDISVINESKDFELTKPVNMPNTIKEKEHDNKNISTTYSTSTPLKQKSIKKLGINTSIITPNSITKTDKNKDKSKKDISILTQNDEESDSFDEDDEDDSNEEESAEEEEEDSKNISKMIDDEAEEASDDYESGDSRDEEEKEYEEQNEIVEKGETLDSEEDFSDDSDYEKGSFIVDSDEEDNDLLSGSGDDLSMSADELSMSTKSKKKYNERKNKQQKKASREMFESRHKLSESDRSVKPDIVKSKKSNRQRLESSDAESGEELNVQPKKSRRARIDSSQDISLPESDVDESISKKKKKVKRLSESVCEATETNEKEITINENNEAEKVDPLSLKDVIKSEPKTPQKDFNISTVAITNIEEIEEVQVDGNASGIKLNQTTDPLQTIDIENEDTDDESSESISENEEITQNYESILKDLNSKSKKIKSLDMSLNLNQKPKEKPVEPIVDQLNLTQVKMSKKKKSTTNENAEPKHSNKDKSKALKTIDNKSINADDEGSSDSIDMKLLFNEDSTDVEEKEKTETQNDGTELEDFIPLKRTEAKTNILDNVDVSESVNNTSILNVGKSKKKQKLSHTEENLSMKEQEQNADVVFFIDTTGAHIDIDKSATNTSIKKTPKKNKEKNVSFATVGEINIDDDSNDTPLEVSYQSHKNNKSKQDLSSTLTEINLNTSLSQSRKKKKNKKVLDSSENNEDQIVQDTGVSNDVSVEVIYQSNKHNKSKQDLNTSESDAVNTSLSQSGKKKKNKKGLDSSQINIEDQIVQDTANVGADKSLIDSESSKKKKMLSESLVEQDIEIETVQNVTKDKKQKKKLISESSVAIENIIEGDTLTVNEQDKTKKRKRKPSANQSIEEVTEKVTTSPKILNTSKTLNESIPTTSQKKKRKISDYNRVNNPVIQTQDDATQIQSEGTEINSSASKKLKKKNKIAQEEKLDVNDVESSKKNKKRKERDDDDADKKLKIIKQNSADKIHVPRLPVNVLKLLDDKPKNEIITEPNVISTTSFKVEESKKRRNKPSQYLEQSVYLNDSIEEKTKKSVIKKPKVLPFIPTASTSDHGFTTKFRINVIPQDTQFVAQSSDLSNFKKEYLHKNRIKKLGTFEMYKRHRTVKISKF